jgi:hypothetical protein
MPGVSVTTAVRTGPAAGNVTPSATFFVVGMAERGPTDRPVRVISLADFESKFGGYVSYGYLHPTIQTYFEEGGAEAYVSRVVGASATVGSLTLNNDGGNPVMTIDAVGAGAWSSNLQVSVSPFGAGVVIRFALNGRQFYSTGEVTSVAQAVSRINRNPRANVVLVAFEEPNEGLPAPIGPTSLSAGNDDRGAVTAATYAEGLNLFVEPLGAGAIAIPGQSGPTIWNAMIEHANNNHRMAICAFDRDTTPQQAVTTALDYGEVEHA